MAKVTTWVKIVVASFVFFFFLGVFSVTVFNTVAVDNAIRGNNYQNGEFLSDRNIIKKSDSNSTVLRVLRNISDEKVTLISSDIKKIINDDTNDSETKDYFTHLKRDIDKLILDQKDATIDTNYYIKKSYIIERLFKTSFKEDRTLYASIIPYYFIKHYNYSKTKKSFQKEQLPVYSAFIHTFISGRTSLDTKCANVFCLYVYSFYCQDTNIKEDTYLRLKSKIDRFMDTFKDEMADSGNMDICNDYLSRAKVVIDKYIKDSGWFLGGAQVAIKKLFRMDTLEPFSKNNL